MAIDPVFSSPAAPEPAVQRSRASDPQAERQAFTLPDDREQAPPASVDAKPKADVKAPADGAQAEGAAAGAQGAVTAEATKSIQTDPSAAFAKVANSKPAASSVTPPVADAGPLSNILAAIEAVAAKPSPAETAQTGVVAEDGVAVPVKPGKKKPGEDPEAVDAAANPAAAQLQSAAAMDATQLAVLMLGLPAPESSTASPESEAKSEAGAEVAVQLVAQPAGGKSAQGSAGVGPRSAEMIPTISSDLAPTVGSKPEIAAIKSDAVTKGQAIGEPVVAKLELADKLSPSSGQAAAAEIKLPETLQQALAPIDLTALVAQAAGKAAHGHPQAAAAAQDPAAAAGQLPQAQVAVSAPTPVHVLPIEIGMRALAGSKRFDIRLDPAELGRVDVSMSISDNGEVSAKLVVDRVETLHLLQRDARTLERAFEQAGLKPSDSAVDITLRDNSDQAFRQQRQQDDAPQRSRRLSADETSDEIGSIAAVTPQPPSRIMRLGGVDLSI